MDRWIILDRDGVINIDSSSYIRSASQWIPIEGSIDAIGRLCHANYRVAVASNQSGIGRGYFSLQDLVAMHKKLETLVEKSGGVVSGIFYCPHLPEDNCICRKPRVGLLDEIENQFGISLKDVPFVGDSESDIQAALAKGCSPVLVKTGKGDLTARSILESANYPSIPVYDDLASYVNALLS